jgi:hypothetical protein
MRVVDARVCPTGLYEPVEASELFAEGDACPCLVTGMYEPVEPTGFTPEGVAPTGLYDPVDGNGLSTPAGVFFPSAILFL